MKSEAPPLPVPKNWSKSIQASLLQVIAFAQYALVYTRSWASNSSTERVRLATAANQLEQAVAVLREEIRIKDARMAQIPPHQRPHYGPIERLAILELRAARAWSLAQTAKVFQVAEATIASWNKRLDEDGPNALLSIQEPVNKFPDFVHHIVQRLQTLCPSLGKVKIAQVLARAGLHLGATTVGRFRRLKPAAPTPAPAPVPSPKPEPMPSTRRVTAKRPNHVWHTDLTLVPILAGFWTAWLPFALPQCWPFCWWVSIVLDHYSRRVLGTTTFKQQPTSQQVRQFLGRVITTVGTAPKYLVTDSGVQFTCEAFKGWCRRHNIRHRKGAVGKTGSIAVIERLNLTLKQSCIRLLPIVPILRRAFHRELNLFATWYNENRPHMTLHGATPDEVYFGQRPACQAPRFEPRPVWPRAAPCALPQTLVKGQPGVRLSLHVQFVAGRRHLPQVTLSRAA